MFPDILPNDLDTLPTVIPVFPLPCPLLLPGSAAGLYTADPGQLRLIQETLEGDGWIGVVQPQTAEFVDDDEPVLCTDPAAPLYSVGCLAFLGEPGDDEDEHLAGVVGGVIRFRVLEELPSEGGYRWARVDYREFSDDVPQLKGGLDFEELKAVVHQWVENTSVADELGFMDHMEGTQLVSSIAQALPFCAAERQALMEAPSLEDLEDLMLTLMEGVGERFRQDDPQPLAH